MSTDNKMIFASLKTRIRLALKLKNQKTIVLLVSAFAIGLFTLFSQSTRRIFFDAAIAAESARAQKIRVAVYGLRDERSLETDLLNAFKSAYNLRIEYFYITDFVLLEQLWRNGDFDILIGRAPWSSLGFNGIASESYASLRLGLYCYGRGRSVTQTVNQIGSAHPTGSFERIIVDPSHTSLVRKELEKYSVTANATLREQFRPALPDASPASELSENTRANNFKIKNPRSCFVSELFPVPFYQKPNTKVSLIHSFQREYELQLLFSEAQAELADLYNHWFSEIKNQSPILRYWDQIEAAKFRLTLADYRRLKRDLKDVFPEWKSTIQKAAADHEVPWLLVAAVAYQESKWKEDAVSPTGVKGIMQLTKKTAEYVGVDDREDAEQSIYGGANYLRYLFEKTPNHLAPFERWIFALASYNIGFAHMRDVRRLASEKEMNPYDWNTLKKLLPLKADPNFENEFYFGTARGHETVQFVESVLSYYKFLKLHFRESNRGQSTQQSLTSLDF